MKKHKLDSDVFEDPGMTDSQGNTCRIRITSTAWGGYMLHVLEKDNALVVLDGGAWKRFLSWMVGK